MDYNVKKQGYNNWFRNNNQWNFKPNHWFMKKYVDDFEPENLDKSLSLEAFESYKYDITWKFWIKSNRALRKIYESYLSIINSWWENKDVQIQIWFAKVGYQESRKNSNLPKGFLRFLKWIYEKLKKSRNDYNQDFKNFLEVLISYHKLFWWKED